VRGGIFKLYIWGENIKVAKAKKKPSKRGQFVTGLHILK